MCLFPHEAAYAREHLEKTDFNGEKSMGAIQDWLLRFADHPHFLETWGLLFMRGSFGQRRFLLERAIEKGGRDDVLRGLAWARTRKVLGPTNGLVAFLKAHDTPASGLLLAWYALHGNGSDERAQLTALEGFRGPHIEEAIQVLASQSRTSAVRAHAAKLLSQDLSGPPPQDPLSQAVDEIIDGRSDPGGVDYAGRQLIHHAWCEAMDESDSASIDDAERGELIRLAHRLLDDIEAAAETSDLTAWFLYLTRILSSAPWAHRDDRRDVLVRALRQTAHGSVQRDALKQLWRMAAGGRLRLDEAIIEALEGDPAPGKDSRGLLAKLRLPLNADSFRSQVKLGRLGDAPPIGLQRHILAQPPTSTAKAGLVALYEVCTETQRRGLLMGLEPPVDPGFVPIILAIANQGSPQTATAAIAALGRCGPWEINGALHGLRGKSTGLDDAIEQAIAELTARWSESTDAVAGALALVKSDGGELAFATDEALGSPAQTGLVLSLAPDNPFDRMASPPRGVPFVGQLFTWVLANNRWNIVWSWLMAMGVTIALSPNAKFSTGLTAAVIGGLGFLGNHFLSGTWGQLRLWKRGRTTWAEESEPRTTRRGSGRNATTTYYYTYAFVAEDGRTYTLKDSDTEVRPKSQGADIRVLYLPTKTGGAGHRRRAVLGPLVLSPDGTLRPRWRSLIWVLVVLAPWFFLAVDAWNSFFRA